MRYKLGSGIIIKSENAAKPASQSSSHLIQILERLSPVGRSIDYGCGKLRYKNALIKTTEILAVVDSAVQIDRQQILFNKMTSIRALVAYSNNVVAYTIEEFCACDLIFDRAFCINVLSVIPFYSKRLELLQIIRGKLARDGTCLFVVQYRNSDFTRMSKMPNTVKWRDGILVDSLRGFSFYGLISPERLENLVEKAGFSVCSRHLNQGSVYLWASVTK